MKKYIAITLISFGFAAQAQTIKQLRRDMYGIASDATEGRFTASPGYLKAANYILRQLKTARIKAYLQPVPFSQDNYSGSGLNIKNKSYPHKAQNFIVIQPGNSVPGKWVVLTPDDPVKGKPAGIILLPNKDQSKEWETAVIRQYRFGYMHYRPDGMNKSNGIPTIMVSPSLAKMLHPGDSLAVNLKHHIENKTGFNVIGIVPGVNKKIKNRTIIIGAHLDHIGRIGRHIYNGANDNASGCVAGLAAAKKLSVRPAKRPVIFVFFCGEELNLKGSRWFADHLPIPQNDIALTVNLEQLGSKHRSVKGIWALGDPQFKTAFIAAGKNFSASELQFSVTDSVKDILSNTDTYSFISKRIPSLLFGSGGFNEHHTPQDKINLIDFPHLRKAAQLLYNFIILIQ